MKRRCATLLLILGLLSPGMAAALGLGGLTLDSYLNQPLIAEVALLETGELDPTQIRVRLATREDFARASVDRAYFLTSLKFEVAQRDDDTLVLLITSQDPVREPYLNFIVEARWPAGRLLREYTLLLDPPIFVGDESGITARASVPVESSGAASNMGSKRKGKDDAMAATSAAQPSSVTDRGYAAGTESSPSSGSRYLVKRSDTLWGIASAARPGGVSVQQTMLDIQRLNREAFIAGNVNQLKAGYVLQLPTLDQITTSSREQAIAEIERQTQRWQDAAAGLDVRMDAAEPTSSSVASGSGSGEGRLEIAGVDDTVDAGISSSDISAQMEDLDRAQRENQDLSNRLSAMEQQMAMQERLISLKDEQIAALQASLTDAGQTAEIPQGELEGTLDADTDDSMEGTIEALDQPSSTDEDSTADSAAADVAAPPARPIPAPRPRPAPEPTLVDMLMANLLYVGAGLLIVVLIVVLLLRNRLPLAMPTVGRRKAQPAPAAGGGKDDDEFADVSLSDESLIVDELDEDAETADVDAPEPAAPMYAASDEQAYAAQFETGDALAEADIYIAYGRFPQAVDLLKAAISVEPANTDYRFKLMEACIEMVESAEFQQQYADLEVIGDENVLSRARNLLEAVDGGEVWLNDLPPASVTPEQIEAALAAGASRAADTEESVDLGIEVEEQLDIDDEAIEALDVDEADLSLDQEFGLDEDSLELEEDSLELEEDNLELEEDSPEFEENGLEIEEDSLELEDDSLELEDGSLELEDDNLEIDDDLDLVSGSSDDDLSALDALDLDTPDADDGATEETEDEDLLDLVLEDDDVSSASTDDDLDDLVADLGADDDSLDLGFDDDSDADLEVDLTTDALELGDDLSDDLGNDLGDESDESDESDEEPALPDLDALGGETDEDADDSFDLSDLSDDSSLDEISDLELELPGADAPGATELEDDLDTLDASLGEAESDLEDLSATFGDDLGDSLGDDLDSDLDGADFGLDADASDDLSDLELDMSEGDDDSDALFAMDGDEIDTKLDLARAYVDMGDHDGARSILDEVVDAGSDAQKQEAKSLLEGLD